MSAHSFFFLLVLNVQHFFGVRQLNASHKKEVEELKKKLEDKTPAAVVDRSVIEKEKEILQKFMCMYCHEKFAETAIADCGHTACLSCLTTWEEADEQTKLGPRELRNLGLTKDVYHATCPVCRVPFSTQHEPAQDNVVVTFKGERVRISGVVKKLFFKG